MTNNATVAPQRQAWVDIAKGIAIIAVVMGHIISVPLKWDKFKY